MDQQNTAPALAFNQLPDLNQLPEESRAMAVQIGNKLMTILSLAVTRYPQIKQSCDRAAMALTRFTAIDDADMDKQANDTLVKVRTTYDTRSAERLEITRELDTIKEFLMAPEKLISTDKKATGSEYVRVVKLRDTYAANEKIKADKAKADAKLKQDKENEVARITAELSKNAINGMANAVQAVALWLAKEWPALTLETIADMEAKLTSEPALKQETYLGWFGVSYNGSLVPAEEYAALVDAAKALRAYDACNSEFNNKAKAITSEWLARIPGKKQELQQIADTAATNAAAAQKLQDDAAAAATEAAEQQLAQLQADQTADLAVVEQQYEDAKMNTAFVAQVTIQGVGEQANTKTTKEGWFDCPEEEIINVLSKVIYHVFTHPDYKGFYKREAKTKEYKRDDQGRYVYEDWLAGLLNFFATNCDATQVPGIKVTEKVSTIQKA